MNEKEFLQAYDITKYDRPSVTADMAVFSIQDKYINDITEKPDIRKLPDKKLNILLIKRAGHPFQGKYALPGGFCKKGESVYETARRELHEETGVNYGYLNLFDVFSDTGRDPRGWIISNGFLALIDSEKYRVHAGSDAWEVNWFEIDYTCKYENESKIHEIVFHKREQEDSGEREELFLRGIEQIIYSEQGKKIEWKFEQSEFAFDHGEIILKALLKLKERVEYYGDLVFELLPEYFTLTELQKTYEAILGRKLLVANFRRKIAEMVSETDKMIEGAGHRPAKLFQARKQGVRPQRRN